MTPAARVAAAIGILDDWIGGQSAEQALTRWARKSRFAGSKDRAAVRDHVFDVLRAADTAAAFGGGRSGRALMIGLLRSRTEDVSLTFNGQGHAPAPLSAEEEAFVLPQDADAFWDLPSWLVPIFLESLGANAIETAQALRTRAPVTLRVNRATSSREQAIQSLAEDGIVAIENELAATALTVVEGARRLRNSTAYQNGLIELQDAASQAVVEFIPPGQRCLDYCAGGGGKSLALAAQPDRTVFAHDANKGRMVDLKPRAERAGCDISILSSSHVAGQGPFDIVLCDVPCSGSGAWRRSPEAKWSFTEARLKELCAVQQEILSRAAQLTMPSGTLVYATCSVLKSENEAAIASFLKTHPKWSCQFERRFDVTALSDGFYTAHLTRSVW